MIGRPMPASRDSEIAILAVCMLKRDAVDVVADMLPLESFYVDTHRRIFGAILDLSRRGEPTDPEAVSAALTASGELEKAGGFSLIADIVARAPAPDSLEKLARDVRDFWRLRQFITTAEASASAAFAPGADIQQFFDDTETKLRAITEPERADSIGTLDDGLREFFRSLDSAGASDSLVVKAGLDTFDERTTGFHPGDLVILAGRPGMGKTAAACAMAVNIASADLGPDRKPRNEVLFFTLEMSREEIAARMVCSEAKVEVQKARSGNVSAEERRWLTGSAEFLAALPIRIDASPSPTPVVLRAKIRRVARDAAAHGRRLAAVFVDHIQIVNVDGASGRKGNRDQDIGKFTAMMKAIAKEIGCPVILLSQLNRAVELTKDKRPSLAHLRDSGNIEQDADNVTFAFRPEYYLEDETPDAMRGMAELIIAKQRSGPTGTCVVAFDGRYTRYESAPAHRVAAYRAEADE